MSRLITLSACLIAAAGCFSICGRTYAEEINYNRQVRVLLAQTSNPKLSAPGEFIIETWRENQPAEIYYSSSVIEIDADRSGLLIKDENGVFARGLSQLYFRPRFPNIVLGYGDRIYKGTIECSIVSLPENHRDKAKIAVINVVDMEDYLKGVLPGELGQRAENEFEALKAQAVAARTYAVWRLYSDGGKHLQATIEDQVYLGAGAEIPLHNMAVEETEGLVMVYKKEPIAAYYHAVCGGSTIGREKAWGGKKIDYLKPVDDSLYCSWAKSYSWAETFELNDLGFNLGKYLAEQGRLPARGFGRLIDIRFHQDGHSRRMMEMIVETSTGTFKIECDKIRWALRRKSQPTAILPSTRFDAFASRQGEEILSLTLEGKGNGHGVGMCQCGAIGRARAGQNWEQILKTYYQGIKFRKIY